MPDCPLSCILPCSYVYSLRLLSDWRLLTADHGGSVRLWDTRRLLATCRAEPPAAGTASVKQPVLQGPALSLVSSFSPSLEDPSSLIADPETGAMRAVGMHALDANTTHLVVGGRDALVRLFSYE